MNGRYAIEVINIRKSFRVYLDRSTTLKEKVIFRKRNRYEDRQVLDGVSFNIRKGESVGLIGSNGCGKSTTLKLLTKIIYPDSGEIIVNGRVSSLLELGAGFHPDMSGRENIYTNASIFGLSRREIDRRLQDIIAFSELEEFIDNPVRTYSSGMYMRLAFSVAINVDADILLIDEILAVGDVNFQKKCMEKIKEIRNKGVTIVIVSHSLGQIEEICTKTIWLEDGIVKKIGTPKEIHAEYQEKMEISRLNKIRKNNIEEDENDDDKFHQLTIRNGSGLAKFDEVWLEDEMYNHQKIFNTGDTITIKARYSSMIPETECIVSIAITRYDGVLCFATNSMANEQRPFVLRDNGILEIKINKCELLADKYMLNIAMTSMNEEVYDDLQRVLFFTIETSKNNLGIYNMDCDWNINDA